MGFPVKSNRGGSMEFKLSPRSPQGAGWPKV